jgi:hypothetical protein
MPHYSWDCYAETIFNKEVEHLEHDINQIDKQTKETIQKYLRSRVKEIQNEYKD